MWAIPATAVDPPGRAAAGHERAIVARWRANPLITQSSCLSRFVVFVLFRCCGCAARVLARWPGPATVNAAPRAPAAPQAGLAPARIMMTVRALLFRGQTCRRRDLHHICLLAPARPPRAPTDTTMGHWLLALLSAQSPTTATTNLNLICSCRWRLAVLRCLVTPLGPLASLVCIACRSERVAAGRLRAAYRTDCAHRRQAPHEPRAGSYSESSHARTRRELTEF